MERRTFLKGAAALAALGTTSLTAFDVALAKAAPLGPMLAPWTGDHGGYPPLDKVTVAGFEPAIKQAMDIARAEIKALTSQKSAPTFQNTMVPLEDGGRELSRVGRLFGIWTSVMSTPEMQKVEEKMSPEFAKFQDEVVQNEALFQRIKAVQDGAEAAGLDAQQKRLTLVQYTGFVRQGAGLDKAKKDRLKEINQKLASLFTKFSQNQLYDEGNYRVVIENEADLAGLPQSLKDAAKGNAERLSAKNPELKGKWVIMNTRSSAEPFLIFSTRRDLRKKVFDMWNSRGSMDEAHANKPVMTQILRLRAERAQLLGYPTHAHWILADNMAKTPDNAMALMLKVWKASTARVKEDVAAMQKIANKEKAGITIEAWDYRHYTEKLRKAKYDLDQNEVKEYLQLDKIREGMFWAAGQVYGVQFAKLEGIPINHPEVTVYEVTSGGKRVGLWYFDPYARDTKQSGAWMNEYRTQEHFKGDVTPIVSNNSNFVKGNPGEPVLISWDDASTMFHEFGHALHGLLSNVTYPTLAGTNVKRDFVEFPSQVNERWLWTSEVLSKYALHYKTGKPMPAALVEKVRKAKTFNQGFITTEYLANAIYDMRLHLAAKPDQDLDPLAFEKALFAEIGMPKEIWLRHPATAFGHIFSGDGYSAGYYVYIWADCMSADASEAFVEAGGFYDRATCDRFHNTIFSVGNSVPPDVAFRNFRGRDVDTNALMRDRGFPVV